MWDGAHWDWEWTLSHVFRNVLLTGIGAGCGLAAALVLTRLMTALLFGVSALDPVTYCSVPVALGAAAWLASYLPAQRATVIEPIDALWAE